MIQMLRQTNLMALVGGGSNPKFPTNKVIIWDDSNNKIISELSFKSEIKNIILKVER
ncbi:MAG: hypothetical protein MJ252_31015 [archaeon]|nr:hypothetical protein [archaeon]